MRKWFSGKSRVGKVLAVAVFIGMNVGWVGSLGTAPTRAPRTGTESTCTTGYVACPSSAELDSISQCICFIRNILRTVDSKLDVIDSKIDLIEPGGLNSKLDIIDSKLDVIDAEIQDGFAETWTAIGASGDQVPGSITPTTVLDVNSTTSFSVIQWLKIIYEKVK